MTEEIQPKKRILSQDDPVVILGTSLHQASWDGFLWVIADYCREAIAKEEVVPLETVGHASAFAISRLAAKSMEMIQATIMNIDPEAPEEDLQGIAIDVTTDLIFQILDSLPSPQAKEILDLVNRIAKGEGRIEGIDE